MKKDLTGFLGCNKIYVYKRKEDFMKAKRLTLSDLNAPKIVTWNTYYWSPNRVANGRRHNEKKRQREVLEWLRNLNQQFGLNLDIKVNGNTIDVFANNEKVAYFHYSESCHNVYKMQNFTKLLKLIKTKI
jgi:hypothetical protein